MDGLVYSMCIICGILEVNMGDTSDTSIFILRKIESRNLSLSLSVSLSLCLSVSLSVCLSVCLSVGVCLSDCWSVFLTALLYLTTFLELLLELSILRFETKTLDEDGQIVVSFDPFRFALAVCLIP